MDSPAPPPKSSLFSLMFSLLFGTSLGIRAYGFRLSCVGFWISARSRPLFVLF